MSKQTRKYLSATGSRQDFLWSELPEELPLDSVEVKEIEIAPHRVYGDLVYVLRIIYKREVAKSVSSKGKVMGVDLGLKNLATIVV